MKTNNILSILLRPVGHANLAAGKSNRYSFIILSVLVGGLFSVLLAACGDGSSNNDPSTGGGDGRLSKICSYDANDATTLGDSCYVYTYKDKQLEKVVAASPTGASLNSPTTVTLNFTVNNVSVTAEGYFDYTTVVPVPIEGTEFRVTPVASVAGVNITFDAQPPPASVVVTATTNQPITNNTSRAVYTYSNKGGLISYESLDSLSLTNTSEGERYTDFSYNTAGQLINFTSSNIEEGVPVPSTKIVFMYSNKSLTRVNYFSASDDELDSSEDYTYVGAAQLLDQIMYYDETGANRTRVRYENHTYNSDGQLILKQLYSISTNSSVVTGKRREYTYR